MSTPRRAARLHGLGPTIFAEMTALATSTGAINLGQGFPDEDGPAEILDAAADAVHAGHNQYAPAPGVAGLRAAVTEHQAQHYGLRHDPDGEVLITFGATEALAAAVLALVDPGDEVVVLDPTYDSYAAVIAFAGATAVRVALRPPDFALDADELRAAVGPRTRAVLLNSPHNPTGRVLSRAELQAVADVCVEHDLIAICDEVYEHLVYDGEHVPLATLDGMASRTVTISSLGKTFALTGWKIGWVCGARELVGAVATVKQFLSFHGATPLQHAAITALGLPAEHREALTAQLRARRDRLCEGLRAAGLQPLVPQGTYFVNADVGHDGAQFCRELPDRCGVVAIPASAFSAQPALGSVVRFAFCKRESVIDDAARRLATLA